MAARKKTTARNTASKKKATKKSTSRKTSAKKNTPSRAPSDAVALLRADHATVKALFEQYEKTRSDERKAALVEQICNELTVHAQIEEEIFYPATREVLRQEDLIDEAAVEHNSVKWLIAQIQDASVGDDQFDAKVKVLSEYVEHHVKEEQNEMFPQVKKTRLDLRALGERLQARKMELMRGKGGQQSPAGGSRSGDGQPSRGGESDASDRMNRALGIS